MALSQRLQLRQSQALVMTPQLMQAIKLLQLSNLDLVAYVEAELEQNPLLDRGSDEPPGVEPEVVDAPADAPAEPADWIGQELETSREAIEQRLDTRLDNVFPDDGERTTPRAAEGP